MEHESDCCESVDIKDIVGSFADLIGHPLLEAEVCQSERTDTNEGDERYTFFKFATIKANVSLSFLGTSNGFYSTTVSGSLREKRNKDIYCELQIDEMGNGEYGRVYLHVNTNHEELLNSTSLDPVRIIDAAVIQELMGGDPDSYSNYTQSSMSKYNPNGDWYKNAGKDVAEKDFFPYTVSLSTKNINPRLRCITQLRFQIPVGKNFLKANGTKPNFGLVPEFEELVSKRNVSYKEMVRAREFIGLVAFKGFKYI